MIIAESSLQLKRIAFAESEPQRISYANQCYRQVMSLWDGRKSHVVRNGAKFIWITGKTSTFRARPQRELIQCWRAMCQPVCAPRFLILRRMRF